MRKLSIVLVIAFLAGPPAVSARKPTAGPAQMTYEQTQKLSLTHSEGLPHQRAGLNVSLDGDIALILALHPTDWRGPACTTYSFSRDGSAWEQSGFEITSFWRGGFYRCPYSAIDGDSAVLGQSGYSYEYCDLLDCYTRYVPGVVGVYERLEDELTGQAMLLAPFPPHSYQRVRFGTPVSIGGDLLLVGDGGGSAYAGRVYVFVRDSGSWIHEITLSTPVSGPDRFGDALSASGNLALIGAPRDADAGRNAGAAYVFSRANDGTWTQQAKLTPDYGSPDASFGKTLSLDGDTALIGADRSAHVFRRSADGAWTRQAALPIPDGVGSVELDGDTALIGVPRDDDLGPGAGAAYVFTRSHGTWTQRIKLTAGDGTAGANLGSSVALDGVTVLLGAPAFDAEGEGAAYLFRLILPSADLVDHLIADVQGAGLHAGTENALLSTLESARMILTDLVDGNDQAAANMLEAFIRKVEAQAGKKIAPTHADRWAAEAVTIIDRLSEPR